LKTHKSIPFANLHAQHSALRKEIDSAIFNIVEKSAFIRGPDIEYFEESFAKAIGTNHCISCANGTDALYIAMKALGVGHGDEVITTAHSWISTSEAITQTGARVVFCDVNSDDFLLDTSKVERLITKKTKGIIPVHLFGQAVDMDPLMKMAKNHNLWVLEDCAQAHFATYKGNMVGTIGDIATFSFYPGKNLGAMGDAGCIVTDRTDLSEHAKLFARHGGKGEHLIEGINSRMDTIQAAILNIKLSYIAEWTNLRRSAAATYNRLLSEFDKITRPTENSYNKHVYHLYVIKTQKRDELKKYLQSQGIQTVINYTKALPFYKAYEYLEHTPEDFPNAFNNQSKILSIPIYPEIPYGDQKYIVSKIQDFHSLKDK